MPKDEIGIGFSVSPDLHQQFKEVARAEHRSFKDALINLMERRVEEHKASQRVSTTEAA